MRVNVFVILCLMLVTISVQAQDTSHVIMFYNLENLFDTEDNPDTADDEFVGGGIRGWSNKKLSAKCKRIYQLIASTGNKFPAVIGFCEVENRKVLERLVNTTPLKKLGYKIIHKDSPDFRGIDVALLYKTDEFTPSTFKHYPLIIDGKVEHSREILQVKGRFEGCKDYIHFFVNHWPSKYSGVKKSDAKRALAGQSLRRLTDSALANDKTAVVVCMGDFNDEPADESLLLHLGAKVPSKEISQTDLYNLSYHLMNNNVGTHKYRNQWSVLDQFIVSGNLLAGSICLSTSPDDAHINKSDFLLVKDEKYLGKKTFRTYNGFKYIGGYSDHLPIWLEIIVKPTAE
ncbi:MAG: hypothetical protein ACK5IQ_08010 [Bacteroidales bacterium]